MSECVIQMGLKFYSYILKLQCVNHTTKTIKFLKNVSYRCLDKQEIPHSKLTPLVELDVNTTRCALVFYPYLKVYTKKLMVINRN